MDRSRLPQDDRSTCRKRTAGRSLRWTPFAPSGQRAPAGGGLPVRTAGEADCACCRGRPAGAHCGRSHPPPADHAVSAVRCDAGATAAADRAPGLARRARSRRGRRRRRQPVEDAAAQGRAARQGQAGARRGEAAGSDAEAQAQGRAEAAAAVDHSGDDRRFGRAEAAGHHREPAASVRLHDVAGIGQRRRRGFRHGWRGRDRARDPGWEPGSAAGPAAVPTVRATAWNCRGPFRK